MALPAMSSSLAPSQGLPCLAYQEQAEHEGFRALRMHRNVQKGR